MKEKLRVIFKFSPYVYILFILFLFAKPYIIDHRIPFPSTYLVNHSLPWSIYNKFWSPVKNDALPDVVSQLYPWKKFTIDTLKTGSIPFWNPYSFAGTPHLANYQSAVLSPLNAIFFIFPFNDAWSILILLQPLFAAFFLYWYMRVIKVSVIGSLITSIGFMFCGFMVVWMTYGTLSMAVSFLPLILFAIEKSVRTKSFFFLTLLSIGVTFSLLSGHFQSSLYSFFVVLGYILFIGWREKDRKLIKLLLLYFTLGVILAMPQLLPTAQLYTLASRSDIYNTSGGLPYYVLITVFAPDFYGNPVTRNATTYYIEWASFVGIIPFFLFIVAFSLRKPGQVLFFQATAIVSLVLSLDWPLQALIQNLQLPVLSTSSPSRMIIIFSFSLCVLAGFGFDRVVSVINQKRLKPLLIPCAMIGFLIFSLWFTLIILKPLSVEQLGVAKRNLILPTVLFSVAMGSLCVAYFSRVKKLPMLFLSLILLLATSFDSLRFAQKWMPFDPDTLTYPQLDSITAIKNSTGTNRVAGRLGNEVVNYFSILGIEGYDPLFIRRYGEFIRSSSQGEFTDAERSVVNLDKRGKYINIVHDLLGVNVIFHPKADIKQPWAFPVWNNPDQFKLFYEDYVVWLYKNTTALKRPMMFYDYHVVSDDIKLLKRFYGRDFDYRNTLLLEKPVPDLSKMEKGDGEAKFIQYTPNRIEIFARTNVAGLLFLSDNYYPGWKAYIDGKETPIYRADYSFRSVVVPKGVHKIIFSYYPESFILGVILAFLGIGGLCILPVIVRKGK